MLNKELQGFVVGWRQLTQKVFNLEEDPFELHADLRDVGGGTSSRCLYFINDDALTLFGQSDEVVIVTEENERLRELKEIQLFKFRFFFYIYLIDFNQ